MINLAIECALEAGDLLLDCFGKVKQIEQKGDRDFATEADKSAEALIVDKIKTQFPSHGILAEENEKKDLDNEWLWIIDPLDGTHNFINEIDIFGVSVGLLHKGEFVGGVIYMPKDKELYVAEAGGGAYKNNQRISVSQKSDLKEASVSFDSSIRHNPDKILPILGNVADKVFNVRMFGSSVRQLSYVAEGKLDLAIEFHDKPWDFAAGVCIIREAGGSFFDLNAKAPTAQTVGYVAANKNICSKAFKEFFKLDV